MSTIDLVLLGSLIQNPKSAYDLQKQVETRNLSRWIKIGSFTAYKKVAVYEKKGYVTSEITKNGNMPEKTIYTITPEGKKKFTELMEKFSTADTRVFLDFNAVIVNLPLLEKEDAHSYIARIKDSIKNTKMQISGQLPRQKEMSLFGQAILKQQFMLLETLEKWEENFEKELLLQQEDNI